MEYQPYLSFGDQQIGYLTQPQALLGTANPLLWHAISLPWEDFQSSRARDARFRSFSECESAWWLHGQIKRFAERLCDDRQDLGVTPRTTSDHQFYLDVRGELVVVFKKLRRVFSKKLLRDVLVRSNYPTPHNCEFWAQRKESGMDSPRLIVGYEPTKAMTEIRIHVGYPRTRGHQFDWIYEMPDQVEEGRRLFNLEIAKEQEPEVSRGFKVVPLGGQSEKRGAQ